MFVFLYLEIKEIEYQKTDLWSLSKNTFNEFHFLPLLIVLSLTHFTSISLLKRKMMNVISKIAKCMRLNLKKSVAIANLVIEWSPLAYLVMLSNIIIWAGIPELRFDFLTILSLIGPYLTLGLSIVGILIFYGVIEELSTLDDDIKDGWSSPDNHKELVRLADVVEKLLRKNKKIVILSGDIHTGGITEFKFKEIKNTFYQITSSPITYPPMPPLVEKLTSGASKMELTFDKNPLSANNFFFISQRNFVVVSNSNISTKVRFVFEDLINEINIDLK